MGYTGFDIKLTGKGLFDLSNEDLLAIQGAIEPLIKATVEPLIKATVEPLIRAAVEPLITRMDSFTQTQDSILKRLEVLEDKVESVHKSQITIENMQSPRIAAALDGYSVNRDKLDEHDSRINFLERKTDIHDTRLFGLEQEKQKA
jgi:uncharacterized protein YicC (UPF0701 family)